MTCSNKGIALIGSCIVDELAPAISPGQLTYTDAQLFVDKQELAGEDIRYSTGGMALNVAIDLAKMAGGYPVTVVGKVGEDHRSQLIRKQLLEHGISDQTLVIDKQNVTSSTEVLHIRMPDGAIERIFRHALGAMGSFCESDIDFTLLAGCKIVMFGYGLLLPQFDLADAHYGAVMGHSLARIRQQGSLTALDFVTPTQDNLWKFLRYRKTLNLVDICCINEDQACSLTDCPDPEKACIALVHDFGVGLAVVHCGSRGPNYAYSVKSGLHIQANYRVPPERYKGNTGAGDAFSAGLLHGIHQEWSIKDSLAFAAAAAAISLADVSATGAMCSEKDIKAYQTSEQLV